MTALGHKLTKEQRQRMSESHKGHKHSEMTKRKIGESNKKRIRAKSPTRSGSAILAWAKRRGGIWYGNVVYNDRPVYCEKFTENFKERVRAFFGYICFECGKPQDNTKLCIHHVHYDKMMCCNGSPRDVVPLCFSCHSSTNHNRDFWEGHLTSKLYAMHPNGKCFFTKDEMKKMNDKLAHTIK